MKGLDAPRLKKNEEKFNEKFGKSFGECLEIVCRISKFSFSKKILEFRRKKSNISII
jgi:hypothetical protein